MGRRRPDWWSEQQQQQQQQQQQEQRRQEQHRQLQDLSDDGCPRNAANARERARMRVLSKAFSRLKTTLPWVPADTKLSKLDTLRLATTYIAHLSSLLATSEQPDVAPAGERAATAAVPIAVTSSLPPTYSVTWPYNAHNHGVKECSSPEDDYRYDCGYSSTLEQKSYSAYDCPYYTASSINS